MLTDNQKHLLKLIGRDSVNPNGWAKVSRIVMPIVEALPSELVESRVNEDGSGLARLTREGEIVVKWI